MKRVGGLFEQVYDIQNLISAHENARRGKSFYTEVKEVNANPAKYLYELQDMIINGTYTTSEYKVFKKQDSGKVREIYKLPYYPDRICQWAIIQVIEPYLLRHMTDDTYSALPGRGTIAAANKVKKALRSDPKGTKWCLKIDIKKYYPNIDREILKTKYERLFKDKQLLDLLFGIIESTDGNGVPIGNYISQYSGNIYLSDFDHMVKEQWKVKHYFRYMDDMVFFGSNKDELQRLLYIVRRYLKTYLHLEVKESWSLFRVEDRGVDFVGYVFRHDGTRLRKSIAVTLKRISGRITRHVASGELMTRRMYCGINSMRGWLKHCDGDGLYRTYIEPLEIHIQRYYDEVVVKEKKVRRLICKGC